MAPKSEICYVIGTLYFSKWVLDGMDPQIPKKKNM